MAHLFTYSCKKICLIGRQFFNSYSKFLTFYIRYDTISKQINKQKTFISVLIHLHGIHMFQAVAASYTDTLYLISKNYLWCLLWYRMSNNRETNTTNTIGLVFWKIARDSHVSGCICITGQHVNLISKYFTFDNLFDTLSINIKQETKK